MSVINRDDGRLCYVPCGQADCQCSRREANSNKYLENLVNYIKENEIYNKVTEECKKQDEKWGVRNMHPASWFLILTEEIGEAAMEVNDANHNTSEIDLEKYEAELVQCASVIFQMIKNIKHYEKPIL